MQKKMFLFCVLLGFVLANAQTYRFIYQVSFRKDSLSSSYIKENVVLDITDKKVKFYPADILVQDSLRIAKGEKNFSQSKFKDKVIRTRGSDINTNFVTVGINYYTFETKDVVQWQLMSDTKMIGGFTVQKAISHFGGRTWEAWFASELPFQEGPYKFQGLPGLILELKDTKGNYIFQFVESKVLQGEFDTSFYVEKLYDISPIKVTEKKMNKVYLDYYSNPMKDFIGGALMVQDKDGNMKTIEPKDVIKPAQERIRRENNPIEISKAVHYPTK